MTNIFTEQADYQPPEMVFLHMHGIEPSRLTKEIFGQPGHTHWHWEAWIEFCKKPNERPSSYLPFLGSRYFAHRSFFQKMVFDYFNNEIHPNTTPITFGVFKRQTELIHELSVRHGWKFRDFRTGNLTPEELWQNADMIQQADAHPAFLKPEIFKDLNQLPMAIRQNVILNHWRIQKSFSPAETIALAHKVSILRVAEAVDRGVSANNIRKAYKSSNPSDQLELLIKEQKR